MRAHVTWVAALVAAAAAAAAAAARAEGGEWARLLGVEGPAGLVVVRGGAADSQGAAVLAGVANGPVIRGERVASGYNALLAKYSREGELAWALSLGSGAGTDQFFRVRVGARDDVFALGVAGGDMDGEPRPLDANLFFVTRRRPDGARVWTRYVNRTGLFTDGVTMPALAVDAQDASFACLSAASGAAVVTRFGPEDGAPEEWLALSAPQAAVRCGGADAGAGDASLALAGDYAGALLPLPDAAGRDVWAGVFDADGSQRWLRALAGPGDDAVVDVAASVEAVYVAGMAGEGGFEGAAGRGGQDAFVAKLAPGDGALLWVSVFGSPQADAPRGVAVDARGLVYVAGFGAGVGGAVALGGNDAFLVALDARSGVLVAARSVGGFAPDYGYAVATRGGGGVLLFGATGSGLAGRTPVGRSDAFVMRALCAEDCAARGAVCAPATGRCLDCPPCQHGGRCRAPGEADAAASCDCEHTGFGGALCEQPAAAAAFRFTAEAEAEAEAEVEAPCAHVVRVRRGCASATVSAPASRCLCVRVEEEEGPCIQP